MKNMKSFPFERNRYFFGKLLSVDDFQTEQKYFNHKRRTVNRFLFGCGVVCGLNVVEVDEESISVERGLALDFAGREIVIDEPVVKRIPEFDGYDDNQTLHTEACFYYLCLEYREEAAELVHDIAGGMDRSIGEYNKYKEGYRLFITQLEPEQPVFSAMQLYEDSQVVYRGQGVIISQVLPVYVQMGTEAMLRVEVSNTGQQQEISFDYDLTLSFLTYRDETAVHIHFDEKEHARAQKYILEIPLKAAYVNGVHAKVLLEEDSFVLSVKDRQYRGANSCCGRLSIGSRDSYQVLREHCFQRAMEDETDSFQQSIYLAKIYVVNAADACVIERIEPLPFQQYVLHTQISAAMIYKLADDVRLLKTAQAKLLERAGAGEKRQRHPLWSHGEVLFDVERMAAGEVLYSDKIIHGLGFEPVSIQLGYEVVGGFPQGGQAMYGDASVFPEPSDGFEAALGARLEMMEGFFVIGMRICKNSGAKKVRVYWTALRHDRQNTQNLKRKQIFIQPDMPNLYTGERIDFTAVLEEFQDERLKWTVKDQDGGEIDRLGRYTAPETSGVFQICVASTAHPEIQATTFVIVREKEEDQEQ